MISDKKPIKIAIIASPYYNYISYKMIESALFEVCIYHNQLSDCIINSCDKSDTIKFTREIYAAYVHEWKNGKNKNGIIRILPKNEDYEVDLVFVAGCMEIPIATSILSEKYDGFVVIGCVIKGDTSHYEYVCNYCIDGLKVCVDKGIPLGNSVLTLLDESQAEERLSKGGEAMRAMLGLLKLKQNL